MRLPSAAPALLVASLLSLESAALAGTVEPESLLDLPAIAELALAPDGKTAALTVDRVERADDRYRSELYLLDLASGKLDRLTPGERSDSAPRFSADGRFLAFLGDAGDGNQIFWLRVGSARARAATRHGEAVEAFAWAPGGNRFVFVAAEPTAEGPDAPIVVRRNQAQRDGAGLLDERRGHLWIAEREGHGAAREITSGPWEDSDPEFSPDGAWIAFVSARQHPDEDLTDDTDIFLVRPDGAELHRWAGTPGPDARPVWSHAGDRLAWIGSRRANDFYQTNQLTVAPLAGGESRDLTGALDAWIAADNYAYGSGLAAPIWSADDREIWTPLEERGRVIALRIASAGDAEPRRIRAGAGSLALVRPLPGGGRFLALSTSPVDPGELRTFDADGRAGPDLTHFSSAWSAAHRRVTPEVLSSTSPDGAAVESWLYPPLDREPGRRYPIVLYVHGGPQGFDGDFFDPELENQLLPAHGIAVLRVNYRGSTSYGEAFSRAVRADWHTREHADLMAALDAALAGHDWLDPERQGIGGWSYGGIQTVWAAAHTGRFRVGVPERFEVDYLAAFGVDQWFLQYLTELGDPFANADLYRRLSPGTYAAAIRTPLFLIADELDHNCPLPQVLELYQRLKLLGQPTELVVYPGESHSMAQPSHKVDRLRRLVDWYGRYLLAPENKTAGPSGPAARER
jgi:dipeptidyl aminopeptidase/acylaminoacyl peptidase